MKGKIERCLSVMQSFQLNMPMILDKEEGAILHAYNRIGISRVVNGNRTESTIVHDMKPLIRREISYGPEESTGLMRKWLQGQPFTARRQVNSLGNDLQHDEPCWVNDDQIIREVGRRYDEGTVGGFGQICRNWPEP